MHMSMFLRKDVNMYLIIDVAANFVSVCMGLVSVCSQLFVCLSLRMVIVMYICVFMCCFCWWERVNSFKLSRQLLPSSLFQP